MGVRTAYFYSMLASGNVVLFGPHNRIDGRRLFGPADYVVFDLAFIGAETKCAAELDAALAKVREPSAMYANGYIIVVHRT